MDEVKAEPRRNQRPTWSRANRHEITGWVATGAIGLAIVEILVILAAVTVMAP